MRSIVVGTAGHIDHGKSALVRALTGTDPDRLKEEKARGITIDLGFAHLQADGVDFGFVDVPGHERFIKNMLAGAGGIDLVMLVVAADESVMPQTREHFQICRLLHIPAGVIVLTKSDLADPDTIELAAIETRELVAGSFLENAPLIAVSSTTLRGLDALRAALLATAATLEARDAAGPVRLPIDRVFSVRGFGTVVTGTLTSGELQDEQALTVLPRGLDVKVRGLQVHGRAVASAGAGRRIAVNLGGVDVADLSRGDTLVAPGTLEPTRRLDAVVELLTDARPLRHGSRVRFHHGTMELLGRVAVAGSPAGEGSVAEIAPGRSAFVRIRLEAPAVLTRGDRFIIRAYSPPVTIGGGTVLDPQPARSPIRTPAGLDRFRRLHDHSRDAGAAILTFLEERGAAGLPPASLISRAGLSAAGAREAIDRLAGEGRVLDLGVVLVAPPIVAALSARLLAALAAHHDSQPLSDGLPREEARVRIFGRAAPAVFEHVVARLVAEKKIVARDRLALSGRQLALTPEEAAARAGIDRVYREAGLTPPDLAAAASVAGVPSGVAERVVQLLLRERKLVKIEALLFHAEALDRLKSEVRALKGPSGPPRVEVAAFKERYGISRKFAIPLLEYLDRERVTRRVGDSRVVL
jgi:selenocysteine-specific elongation factor